MPGNIKPKWLNKSIDLKACGEVKNLLRGLTLNTVCEEAKCPNMGECFSCGVVTIMILGSVCTRGCRFCGVAKSNPPLPDKDEPYRIKTAVEKLKLKHVVLTSPTRDDLPDGGLNQFITSVNILKTIDPAPDIEILVPDFGGNKDLWKQLAFIDADIIAHNVETVPSLYKEIRIGADYQRSLDLLKTVKEYNPDIITKSGLMLGLGESKAEVMQVLHDLRAVNCNSITIGQYLAPSKKHYPVKEYIDIAIFSELESVALDLGFGQVKCAPYVRSSYLAQRPE